MDFQLRKGHTLGIVGESGSGKTTLGLTRSCACTAGRRHGGEARFGGQDLFSLDRQALQAMRRRIQVVFQNPYASLNPRFTIGQTLREPMEIHGIGSDTADRTARAVALLQKVGLDGRPCTSTRTSSRAAAPAHRHRALPDAAPRGAGAGRGGLGAGRLGPGPGAEPAQDLQDEFGLSYLFISHDLAVVKFISDEVLVMQNGAVVEQAATAELMAARVRRTTRAACWAPSRAGIRAWQRPEAVAVAPQRRVPLPSLGWTQLSSGPVGCAAQLVGRTALH